MAAAPNFKTSLTVLLQKLVGQTLRKGDVVYTNWPGGEQFQSSVRLACLQGEEWTGDLQATEKEAEQSAAQKAYLAHLAEAEALPNKPKKQKQPKQFELAPALTAIDQKSELVKALQVHCRRTMTKADVVYMLADCGGQFVATVSLMCLDGREYSGQVSPTEKLAEHSAAHYALLACPEWPPAPPPPPPVEKPKSVEKRKSPGAPGAPGLVGGETPRDFKTELVQFLQVRIRRTLTRGDIAYTKKHDLLGHYQAVVQLACLEGKQFPGLPAASQKAAEQAAAHAALQALGAATFMKQAAGTKKAKVSGAARTAPSPAVPRQPIQDGEAFTGEVLEWNANGWGWIAPHNHIEHPMADAKEGRIYVRKEDLLNVPELNKGALVQFTVYVDKRGLGAADVQVF